MCASVRECARVCASVRECARVCASVRECARVCASVRVCVRVCARACVTRFPRGFGCFSRIKKLLGRTETRIRDRMYCQSIRTI